MNEWIDREKNLLGETVRGRSVLMVVMGVENFTKGSKGKDKRAGGRRHALLSHNFSKALLWDS